jgi:hypothetical protein
MRIRTALFSGFGRKTGWGSWKSKTKIEYWKFGVYLTVPVVASFVYGDPEVMTWLINTLSFVQYPATRNLKYRDESMGSGKGVEKGKGEGEAK